MKTVLTETGQLSSQISITIEPDDYQDKFQKELKKYREKAHIKGFRKGKMPLTAVKKMYGKALLADIINTKLQDGLTDFISKEDIEILGNPIPSENHEPIDFDLKEMGEYAFHFDLGLAPKFEVEGLEGATYDQYKVTIDEDMIDEEIINLKKRLGTQEDTEAPIEEMDILTVYAVEKEGADRDVYTTEFSIMVERMTEAYKTAFVNQKKGFSLEVDIFHFEKDTSEDYVRKYFIKDAPEDVNHLFDIEVKEVKRLVPAELNNENLEKAFGAGEVADEAAARDKIREDLEKYFADQTEAVTKRFLMEGMVAKNDIELPREFLKRWLISNNPEINPEQIDSEFEDFTKNLRWTLIKSQLAKKFEIKVETDDIRQSLVRKVKKQFGAYQYEGINYYDIANNMMQKQETVQKEYEELLAENVLQSAMSKVTFKDKKLTIDEFKNVVKELQQNFG